MAVSLPFHPEYSFKTVSKALVPGGIRFSSLNLEPMKVVNENLEAIPGFKNIHFASVVRIF